MKKYDVVYLLKNDYDSDELRYSVRSVVKNFPYNRIVFVGGKPEGIEPDIYIPDEQEGKDKWAKSSHSLKKALECTNLTDQIWLFNDDFFIMEPVEEPKNYFGGTLAKRIKDLRKSFRSSAYIRALEDLEARLSLNGRDTLSFVLHVPMLVNRSYGLMLFELFPSLKMFRSFYGNYYRIPCEYMEKDVKVYDNETVLGTKYLSTSDDAFENGRVGGYIRGCFPEPCKYERKAQEGIHELYTEEGDEIHIS